MNSPCSAERPSLATEYVPTEYVMTSSSGMSLRHKSQPYVTTKSIPYLACSDFYFISKLSGYTQQKKHEVPYYSQHWVTANQPIQHSITDLLETGLSHSVNIDCRPATGIHLWTHQPASGYV